VDSYSNYSPRSQKKKKISLRRGDDEEQSRRPLRRAVPAISPPPALHVQIHPAAVPIDLSTACSPLSLNQIQRHNSHPANRPSSSAGEISAAWLF
ncbi:unnamed protein product, partial [Linum tenue]